jgi:hypothetical protein
VYPDGVVIMILRIPLLVLLAITSAAAAASGPKQFTSGAHRVLLLELYTSEGCSSCPPADRWVSGLKRNPGLWTEFVPIVFHVDYWDYIGWRDRFADPAHSDRQRRHIAQGNAGVVYTPGMFLAGYEWLDWRRADAPKASSASAGRLTVQVNSGSIDVRYQPRTSATQTVDVHIAVLGMELETEVRRGENRGRRLQHDFVVLDHQSISMESTESGFLASAALATDHEAAPKRALAVWVSPADTLEPLQAAGGLLD